jgi:hypothetical protein
MDELLVSDPGYTVKMKYWIMFAPHNPQKALPRVAHSRIRRSFNVSQRQQKL